MSRRPVEDDLGDVRHAIAWVEALASEAGLPEDVKFAIEICLEESLANLIVHGRAVDAPKTMALTFSAEPPSAVIVLSDNCEPFDVAKAAIPAGPSSNDPLEGGQGLRLLHAFAGDLTYVSDGGENRLTMTFRPALGDDAADPGEALER